VTFKDLKKRVSLEATQQQYKLLQRLQNKPFWIWDQQQHKLEDIKTNGDCCFNHIISLPTNNAVDNKPLYDLSELSSQGYNQSEISGILQISQPTINRDITYLRQQAKTNIKRYIDERLPEEYEKCLVGLMQLQKKHGIQLIAQKTGEKSYRHYH
jgi:hypothetical protein